MKEVYSATEQFLPFPYDMCHGLIFSKDLSNATLFYHVIDIESLFCVCKIRQSMTACSLLRRFLLRMPYLAALSTYQRSTTDEVPKQIKGEP